MNVGDQTPSFRLQNQHGDWVNSNELLGKFNIVLFFYPADNTAVCTMEACSFRDHFADFEGLDAKIIGVSKDGIMSHTSFAEKQRLNFDLLSDPEGTLHGKFDVKRQLFGLVPARKTFVIDKKGSVRAVFDSAFIVKKHVAAALKTLEELA
jgi:peroxiredoxin Q/BCP